MISFKYILIIVVLFFTACKEQISTPPNTINFDSDQLGMNPSENQVTITINFNRALDRPDSLGVRFSSTTLKYGADLKGEGGDADFITSPVAEDDLIILRFDAQATSASFTVRRAPETYPRSDEQVTFTIASYPFPAMALGSRIKLTLSFSEITAEQATLNPGVGGAEQPNTVFVDLSANRQHAVRRDSWDLGFYNRAGQFRVILNYASGMMARALDKSDMGSVTPADSMGFGPDFDLSVGAIVSASPEWTAQARTWIDNPSGDLDSTAISEISAVDEENKVYIVTRGTASDGTPRGWKKIRILRNGDGYQLQHADIGSDVFEVLRISRDDDYFFQYVNFEDGLVSVEPRKEQWDIAFTVFTNLTAFGPPGAPLVPYVFTDFVLQNYLRGVAVAQLYDTSVVGGYEAFGEAEARNISLDDARRVIGSTWRRGGGPGRAPALYEDRFYLVRDAQDNLYKLRFTALTQNGERGRPRITFRLLQKAEPNP